MCCFQAPKVRCLQSWYSNLDRLIRAVTADGRAEAFYSTPAQYFAAKAAMNATWPLKVDDHFPYADRAHDYWTGVGIAFHAEELLFVLLGIVCQGRDASQLVP